MFISRRDRNPELERVDPLHEYFQGLQRHQRWPSPTPRIHVPTWPTRLCGRWKDCVLRRFQQLRPYRHEIETQNWKEITFSSRILPMDISVAEAPKIALHNAAQCRPGPPAYAQEGRKEGMGFTSLSKA